MAILHTFVVTGPTFKRWIANLCGELQLILLILHLTGDVTVVNDLMHFLGAAILLVTSVALFFSIRSKVRAGLARSVTIQYGFWMLTWLSIGTVSLFVHWVACYEASIIVVCLFLAYNSLRNNKQVGNVSLGRGKL